MLILVRGLPGSGKSTYAKSLNIMHIEADMYHMKDGVYMYDSKKQKAAHEWCCRTTKSFLLRGIDVVVSNTFTQKWELEPYISMAKETQTPYQIVTMKNQYGNIHNVPQEVIEKMTSRWEEL